jgi:hypothetical protein
LNFVGQFNVPQEIPELTPEEQAIADKKFKRKLERRAYHKQWRDKKKAEREAAKAETKIVNADEKTIVIDADDSPPKPAA